MKTITGVMAKGIRIFLSTVFVASQIEIGNFAVLPADAATAPKITGRVTVKSANPDFPLDSGMTVSWRGAGTGQASVVNGSYTTTPLVAGTYSVIPQPQLPGNGYAFYEKKVTVYSTTTTVTADFLLPGKPTDPGKLFTMKDGKVAVVLTWNHISSNATTGFIIRRGIYPTMPDASTVTLATTKTPGVKTYTDTTAVGGQTYYYRIQAYNDSGLARMDKIFEVKVPAVLMVLPSANGSIGVTSSTQPLLVDHPAGSWTTYAYPQGTLVTLTGAPSADHLFDRWGGALIGYATSPIMITLATNKTVMASFKHKPYTISATAGSGGTISPGSATVNHGDSATFTIMPNVRHAVSDVKVDGVSVGKVASYTFSNVTANHTITASFVVTSYLLTVTQGANGDITPSASQAVSPGANFTFTITPKTGYVIDQVTVDGSSAGAVGVYTFTNITADHTIGASFKPKTCTLTCRVLDYHTLAPIAGAVVSVSQSGTGEPFVTNTGNDGKCSIGYLKCKTNYEIITTATNYSSDSRWVTINESDIPDFAILLDGIKPGGTCIIYGTITNNDGDPLEGALITVKEDADSGVYSDYAGSGGNYRIEAPKGKTYALTVSKEGYNSQSRSPQRYDQNTCVDVQLEKIAGNIITGYVYNKYGTLDHEPRPPYFVGGATVTCGGHIARTGSSRVEELWGRFTIAVDPANNIGRVSKSGFKDYVGPLVDGAKIPLEPLKTCYLEIVSSAHKNAIVTIGDLEIPIGWGETVDDIVTTAYPVSISEGTPGTADYTTVSYDGFDLSTDDYMHEGYFYYWTRSFPDPANPDPLSNVQIRARNLQSWKKYFHCIKGFVTAKSSSTSSICLQNVNVRIDDDNGWAGEELSEGSYGYYRVPEIVLAGSYTLTATKSGYKDYVTRVEISHSPVAGIDDTNIVMQPTDSLTLLQGTVKDIYGQPVCAKITCEDAWTETDASGKYEIYASSTDASCTVSASGYQTWTGMLSAEIGLTQLQ